jgi:16S rRNA (cytosine967-C5)-methyltransferase
LFFLPALAARHPPDGIVVDRGNLREAAVRGDVIVQDEASQLVALLAGASPGPLVLDTCASPGGKATAIAADLEPGERLIACDVRARRMALLQWTVAAAGAGAIRLVQADVTTALPFRAAFSTVIVDAPCSGLGTLRRDPDIRWRRDEASLSALAAAQRSMLANAAAVVAEGGRLVYATCSSEPEENEQVVEAFAAAHPGFRPLRADQAHPLIAPELVDAGGHLRTEPDRHGLELFFGAVFERVGHL